MKSGESTGQAWRGIPVASRSADAEDQKGQSNIEALQGAIMEEAREEVRQILDDAKAKAQSIYQQVEAEVGAEGESIIQQAQREAEHQRSQAVATARIEAQKLKLQRREQLLDRVYASVREQLTSAPRWPEYEQIARDLVREAMAHMDTDHALVRCDPETRKVLTNEVLADLSTELGVYIRAGDPLTLGTGVLIETPDGHRRYDNTLETRLARIQASLRTTVHSILIGEAA